MHQQQLFSWTQSKWFQLLSANACKRFQVFWTLPMHWRRNADPQKLSWSKVGFHKKVWKILQMPSKFSFDKRTSHNLQKQSSIIFPKASYSSKSSTLFQKQHILAEAVKKSPKRVCGHASFSSFIDHTRTVEATWYQKTLNKNPKTSSESIHQSKASFHQRLKNPPKRHHYT